MVLACQLATERNSSIDALYVIEVPLNLPIDASLPEERERARQVLETRGAGGGPVQGEAHAGRRHGALGRPGDRRRGHRPPLRRHRPRLAGQAAHRRQGVRPHHRLRAQQPALRGDHQRDPQARGDRGVGTPPRRGAAVVVPPPSTAAPTKRERGGRGRGGRRARPAAPSASSGGRRVCGSGATSRPGPGAGGAAGGAPAATPAATPPGTRRDEAPGSVAGRGARGRRLARPGGSSAIAAAARRGRWCRPASSRTSPLPPLRSTAAFTIARPRPLPG